MQLSTLDWLVIAGYGVFVLTVGIVFAKRAGRDVDQFFLSGRSLPWWLAGTSMVATTFASDTPLVITGWVRDSGIWENWIWWSLAGGSLLTVFLFARYWRRGEVMTTAELAELRYGGAGAKMLRGFLGTYQALITNTIIMCWVILAAAKIMDVLFEVDKFVAVTAACLLALTYSSLAGFWGVVTTDLVQFAMAMVGAVLLAVFSWDAIGGLPGLETGIASGLVRAETLAFIPPAGEGSFLDASFWTTSLTAVALYLGVAWWANDLVDGGSLAVQRISACKSERDGVLASLWYSVAHYALRPWPWIVVAIASIIVLPTIEVHAPSGGVVQAISDDVALAPDGETELPRRTITLAAADSADTVIVPVDLEVDGADWAPKLAVDEGDTVEAGALLARTDSERAYVVMMQRFLPAGLLGLAIASLLAAFMSTIDTHVNLASSFFVNDIYRRFLAKDRSATHYVWAGRVSSFFVLAIAGSLAAAAESISDLFTFFMAFLSGVGPVYILRWLWWRMRASTEVLAILTSSITATYLTFPAQIEAWFGVPPVQWSDTIFTPGGQLEHTARVCIVVVVTGVIAFGSLLVLPRPDASRLVPFFRKVRPAGFWGPVQALCPDVVVRPIALPVGAGFVGGLMMIFGLVFGIGHTLFGAYLAALVSFVFAIVGAGLVMLALGELSDRAPRAAGPGAPTAEPPPEPPSPSSEPVA